MPSVSQHVGRPEQSMNTLSSRSCSTQARQLTTTTAVYQSLFVLSSSTAKYLEAKLPLHHSTGPNQSCARRLRLHIADSLIYAMALTYI